MCIRGSTLLRQRTHPVLPQQPCRPPTSVFLSRVSTRCSLVRRSILGCARGRLTVKPAEELLALPAHPRPHHSQAPSPVMSSPRAPREARPLGLHITPENRVDPLQRSASPPARQGPRAPVSSLTRRPSNSDEERRHACPECGKAFNRPSSLAIHVNTHTGAKRECYHPARAHSLADFVTPAFQCPFPGCGRRFNVNSNMRRHFRNHTSPHQRLNAASPYTYPLTTIPRDRIGFSASCPTQPSMCPPPPYGRGSSASASDEDELSEQEYLCDRRLEDTRDTFGRMRIRAYSTSSASARESPANSPSMARRALSPVAHRPRSHTYTGTPGYYVRPNVLHPSSEAHRRH